MRILNNSHPEITKNNEFKYLILGAFPEKKKAKNKFFSPEERLSIIEKYNEEIKTIARDYLGRKDGVLFYEPLPDPNEPFEPYKGLPAETVVQAFGYVLFKQQEKIVDLQTALKNINTQLNQIENNVLKEIVVSSLPNIKSLVDRINNHEEQNTSQWEQLKLQWDQINNYHEQALYLRSLLSTNNESNEILSECIAQQKEQLKSNQEQIKNLIEKQDEYLRIIEQQNKRIEEIEKRFEEMNTNL